MWQSMRGLNICTAALLAASMTPFTAQSSASITEELKVRQQTQQITASAPDASAQGQTETPDDG